MVDPAPVQINMLPLAGSTVPLPQVTDLVPVDVFNPNKFGPGVGGYQTVAVQLKQLAETIVAPTIGVFAGGIGHKPGLVPDPGPGGGTTRFLREDATWTAIRTGSVFFPEDYGVTFDGQTIDDTAAWQSLCTAMLAANGGTVQCPGGKTSLVYSTGVILNPLFQWQSASPASLRFNGNGLTFKTNRTFTSGVETVQLFNFVGAASGTIDGVTLTQTVPVNQGVNPYGAMLVLSIANSQNITITNCNVNNAFTLFQSNNTNTVTIAGCSVSNSFYGINPVDGTTGITVTGLYSNGNDRAVYLKAVTNANINVTSINSKGNDILLSNALNNQVLSDITINYCSRPRTSGSIGSSYIYIGQGTLSNTVTGSIYRNIQLNVDIDMSGDPSLAPVIQLGKATGNTLGLTFENIVVSGKVSNIPNFAGNLFDLFSSGDQSWANEFARNISLINLTCTGSTTPAFYVDYAPFDKVDTLAGGLSMINFKMPGNYTDNALTNANLVTQLFALNSNRFANGGAPLFPRWGGTGVATPAAHNLFVAQGNASCNMIAPIAGGVLASSATNLDPAFSKTPTLGASGSAGSLTFGNATSGLLTIQPVTGALGTVTLSLPAATDTLVGKATTDILTNKTFDTAGAGNLFKINGTTINAVTGTGSTAVLSTSPVLVTPTLGVATATSLQVGASGTLGTVIFGNATSGLLTLQTVAGALGSPTLSLPAATDTLIGKATTDILTNKTFDTAGTGNVFKINGTTVSAVTGTGSTAVLSASPTFTGTVLAPIVDGGSAVGSTLTLNGTSNGAPVNAYLLLQQNGQNVAIGTTTPKVPLHVSTNASTTPVYTGLQTTAIAAFIAAESTSGSGIVIDSYSGVTTAQVGSYAIYRAANGSATTPSALAFGSQIGGQRFFGYDGTSYQQCAAILVQTGQAFSVGNSGTFFDFYTTPNGGSIGVCARFHGSGGMSLGGSLSDPGAGLIYTNSASFLLRTKTSLTGGSTANAPTLTAGPLNGNPTKWLPYDDNGTTRFIPSW